MRDHALRLLLGSHSGLEVLDRLEGLGVLVGRLDERSLLAIQDALGTRNRRVNQSHDLETRTKLVLKTERVASDQ